MEHELDEHGEPIHVDVDPFIPTGRCALCTGQPIQTETTEGDTA